MSQKDEQMTLKFRDVTGTSEGQPLEFKGRDGKTYTEAEMRVLKDKLSESEFSKLFASDQE